MNPKYLTPFCLIIWVGVRLSLMLSDGHMYKERCFKERSTEHETSSITKQLSNFSGFCNLNDTCLNSDADEKQETYGSKKLTNQWNKLFLVISLIYRKTEEILDFFWQKPQNRKFNKLSLEVSYAYFDSFFSEKMVRKQWNNVVRHNMHHMK